MLGFMEEPEPVSPPRKRPQSLTAGADRGFMLLAGLVIFASLATIAVGACMLMLRWKSQGNWDRATAVVVQHRPDLLDEDGTAVYVDARFAAPRQGECHLRLWAPSPDLYPIGSAVAVRYNPAMPQVAREDSFGSLYGQPLAMMGAGAVFGVLGLLFGRIFYRGYERKL